jgi:hypothetical protein
MTSYRPLQTAAVLVLALCAGCGGGGPFEYVPVTGKITYDDGSVIPAPGMKLQFIAQDVEPVDGMYPRPASADLNGQGEFTEATSHKYADGLIPGKHKVALMYATDANGKPVVPAEYTDSEKTPLVVDTANLPLEIKVPKP